MRVGAIRPSGYRLDMRVVGGAIAGLVAALGVTFFLTGFPVVHDYSQVMEAEVFPDVLHERAMAWEALWGDPHRPLSEILSDHGYEGATGGPSPRTPAALLLQTPLLLIPAGLLMPVVTVAILSLLGVAVWLTARISGVDLWKVLWATPLLVISLPVVTSISYAPMGGVITVALILVSWRYQDRVWAGVPLGMAVALKLWPGLMVIGLWLAGRRRVAYLAGAVFAGLNIAGLLLPGAGLTGAIESLVSADTAWLNHNMNASLALVLMPYGVPAPAATLAVVLAGLWLAYRNVAYAVPICLMAALVASPLSWPAYAIVALPVVGLYWRHGHPAVIALLALPLVFWTYLPSRWLGHAHFVVLLLLLLFVAWLERPAIGGVPRPSVPRGSQTQVARP